MVCDTKLLERQTAEDRRKQVQDTVAKLEMALGAGTVKVVVGPSGAITFVGWNDRNGISDACAYRKLTASGSWALRQAVTKAEAAAGRKVDQKAVASGVHSHDGGKTWGKH